MRKRLISLMTVIVMVASMFTGTVFAAGDDFYSKIQDLSSSEKAALVGIFWTYIAGYNGGSSTATDIIVNNIQNDLIAIGFNQKFIDKGITESVIRDAINNVKNNASEVKAVIDLQKLTSNTELNNALSELVDRGIITSGIKDLASSNLVAMLDAFSAIDKPIFTKDSSGTVIVKEDNLDLLVELVNIFIESGSGTSADQFAKLAEDAAAAINGISDTTQKDSMISVLESFKIYEAPAELPGGDVPVGSGTTPSPTPTPAQAGDTASKGQETLNNAIKNENVITPEIAQKVSDAVKTIIEAAPKNEDEAGTVSKAISDASENLLQAIGKAVNEEVKNQIAQDTAKLVAAIADNLSVVTTEAKAVEVIGNVSAALANAGEVAKALNSDTSREAVYDNTASAVKSIADVMNLISTPQKAVEIAQTLINDTSRILGLSQEAKASVKEEVIAKELAKVAEKAIEKLGREEVTGQYTGAVLTSAVSDEQAANITSKINEVISTADSLASKLKEANPSQKIEKKVTIAVTSDSATEVQVQLPSAIMDAAAAKKLDKIEVSTGLAAVALSPDAFSTADVKNVSLSIKSIDKSSVPAEIKSVVGDAPVYDFNLTVSRNSGSEEKVSSFSIPADVKVPYTLGSGENPEKVSVFFINDNGILENMAGIYDAATGTVAFSTGHFSKYVVREKEVVFNDLSNYEWARTQVEVMAAKGAIGGMVPGFYSPEANVTRAQFASIIVKALNLFDENAEAEFADVAKGDWYYSAVASAVKAGIIAGYPDKTFQPNTNISRQDMAVMAAHAMEKYKGSIAPKDISGALDFADAASISDYARNGAAIATKYDIITGMPGKAFAPKENANRAQAAVIIYKIFNLQ